MIGKKTIVVVTACCALIGGVALWPTPDPRKIIIGEWLETQFQVKAAVSEQEICFSMPDDRRPRTFRYVLNTDTDPCEITLFRPNDSQPVYTALLEFEGTDRAKSRDVSRRSILSGGIAGDWMRIPPDEQ